jgi:hypothetical protein
LAISESAVAFKYENLNHPTIKVRMEGGVKWGEECGEIPAGMQEELLPLHPKYGNRRVQM